MQLIGRRLIEPGGALSSLLMKGELSGRRTQQRGNASDSHTRVRMGEGATLSPMRLPLAIGQTLRNARRTREILGVFVRYGFQHVIQELGLDTLKERSRNLFRTKPVDVNLARLPQPVRVRKALEELGPTFVKFGQVLSLRPDLIPPEWADEFRKLHDTVQPVPSDQIMARLREQFPGNALDELFESIEEEPLAAASVAQVHRAVTKEGDRLVLKILRPGIEDVLETDMNILRFLAEFAEEHFQNLGYSPTEVVEQFARELKREVDLEQEGRSTDRFRADFEKFENISFPKVHWKYTTGKVLALEEIKGTLLSKLNPEDYTEAQLRTIVANGTDAVFHQCLEVGFFHADPHPGNIFVLPKGKVCFIDCGMTGHVDPKSQGHLADLVQGVLAGDLDRVMEVVVALGDLDPNLIEDRVIRTDVWEFIARFQNATLEDLDIGGLLNEFFEKLRRNKLRCPGDIVFLIKAITTIQSVGLRLVPDYDLVGHVTPYVERLVRRRHGYRALRKRLQDSTLAYAGFLEVLPFHARGILHNLRRNRLAVNLEHRGLNRLTETIDTASGHIAHAVFVGSLIMGSSVLLLADSVREQPGVLSLIAGVTFVAAIALAIGHVLMSKIRRR